jgi:hypothetical protein
VKYLSILIFGFCGLLAAQAVAQPPGTVQVVAINNITSQATVIDNRSTQRTSNVHTFCVTGTGSWSVTIQYSDVATTGPWNSFADGDATVANTAPSCIGAASGYHAYLRFNITGTVSINYTGTKNIYIPTNGGTGGGGSPAFNSITSGTNGSAVMTLGTGASMTFSGSGIVNANQLMGASIAALTGLIKMSSGVPSIATSATIIALWTGTCNSSSFLRGDGSCQTPAGGGSVTSVNASATGIFAFTGGPITGSGTLALGVTGTSGGIPYFSNGTTLATSAALSVNAIVLGGGAGAAPSVLGSLGTTTQVLHGNGAGPPSFTSVVNADIANATIDLTSKVTAILPGANGGTNNGFMQFAGPGTSLKTFTLPNASANILTDNAVVTVSQGGTSLGSITAHAIMVGNGTSAPTLIAPAAVNFCFEGSGVSSDPGFFICPFILSGSDIQSNPSSSGNVAITGRFSDTPTVIASAASITIDLSKGSYFSNILTANVTSISITNSVSHQSFKVAFAQNGTGNFLVSGWPGTVSGPAQPDLGANMVTIQQFDWDGTTYQGGPATCPTCSPTYILGPERTAITSSTSGVGVMTYDSSSHTAVYYANASSNRHAIPRVVAGDVISANDFSLGLTETSSSATVYTTTLANGPLQAYATRLVVYWLVGMSCSGGTATTMNIDGLGAKSVKQADGSTDPTSAQCAAGMIVPLGYDGTRFRII